MDNSNKVTNCKENNIILILRYLITKLDVLIVQRSPKITFLTSLQSFYTSNPLIPLVLLY